jgi:hypothetical protein
MKCDEIPAFSFNTYLPRYGFNRKILSKKADISRKSDLVFYSSLDRRKSMITFLKILDFGFN